MDNIIGVCLLTFALIVTRSIFNNSSDPLIAKKYIQLAISGFGGLVVLYGANKDRVNNLKTLLLSKIKKDTETKQEENTMDKLDETKGLLDFKALTYLKSRALEIKSQECLELVNKINTILFNSDTTAVKNE